MTLAQALRGDNVDRAVPAHQLAAALQLWAEGLVTRDQALAGARVPASAEADIDALAGVYGAKTSAVAKLAFLNRVEKVAIVLQDGLIDDAQFNTFLELPPAQVTP